MELEFRIKELDNFKYQITVELKEDDMELYRKGFKKFYQGVFNGKKTPKDLFTKLRVEKNEKGEPAVRTPAQGPIRYKEGSTELTICETYHAYNVQETGDLRRALNKIEERFYLITRDQWVNWDDYFAFYRGRTHEADIKKGTPVERLKQAAYDTRRTGIAQFHFGQLMGYQPDVELMFKDMFSEESDEKIEIEDKVNTLAMEVHEYETNEGTIKPILSIEEADKVAKLFERQADLIEHLWEKVEKDYEKTRGGKE